MLQQLAEGEQGEASNVRTAGWPHARLSGSHSTELSWGSTASSDSRDAHSGSEGPTSPSLPSLSLNLYSYKMGGFSFGVLQAAGGVALGTQLCPGK